jgi:NAD-dependent DNA ligase
MSNIVKKIIKDPLEIISNLTVEDLEEVIIYTNDKYRDGTPVIEDTIYDLLIEFLEARSPKSKILKQIGATVKSKNKVILDYTLASMDKIKPSDTSKLEKWLSKFKPPYYASDKLDGISALLIYTHDKLINLFTRGDGVE